jgi:hypothetical protein
MRPAASIGERSAALAIGLALLLMLTLLALVSVRGARLDAGRATGAIAARTAFEAAERGLRAGIARTVPPAAAGVGGELPDSVDGGHASFRVEPDRARAPTDVPTGFSLGVDSEFRAYPFVVTANGSAQERRVRLSQDILVVGARDD